jgi:DNA transformation protein
MLGCYGVYTDGLCFAIATGGEAFLKVDGETEATFSTAGSSPFIYEARASRSRHLARLPTEAYDDADALRRWAELGLGAARRNATAKKKHRVPVLTSSDEPARRRLEGRDIGLGQYALSKLMPAAIGPRNEFAETPR